MMCIVLCLGNLCYKLTNVSSIPMTYLEFNKIHLFLDLTTTEESNSIKTEKSASIDA